MLYKRQAAIAEVTKRREEKTYSYLMLTKITQSTGYIKVLTTFKTDLYPSEISGFYNSWQEFCVYIRQNPYGLDSFTSDTVQL